MSDDRNPLVKVTIDGVEFVVDVDAMTARHSAAFNAIGYSRADLFADLLSEDGFSDVCAGCLAWVARDQAGTPVPLGAALDLVGSRSVFGVELMSRDEPAPQPVKKAPAKKAPAARKRTSRTVA